MTARITTRRGRLGVYWKDVAGGRHFQVTGTPGDLLSQQEAERLLLRVGGHGAAPADLTVEVWIEQWLARVQLRRRRSTWEFYEHVFRNHIQGTALGKSKLLILHRRDVKAWCMYQIESGAAPGTLRSRLSILRAALQEAVEDEFLPDNPAREVVRSLHLPPRPKARAYDQDQIARFLTHVAAEPPQERFALLFYCCAGLRLSEAYGAMWPDVLEKECAIRVERQVYKGVVGPPKTASGVRRVDVPKWFIDELLAHRRDQKRKALAEGRPATQWVLGVEPEDSNGAKSRVHRAMKAITERAGLPPLSPHGLRHSWFSLHQVLGMNLMSLKDQGGHSDLQMTGHYAGHLKAKEHEAAERLGKVLKGGFSGRRGNKAATKGRVRG